MTVVAGCVSIHTLTPQLVEVFNAAIAINSTAFEDVDPENGVAMFIGSKTETALLKFAKELSWTNYKVTRDAVNVIQMVPFSSERKSMGCVARLPDRGHCLYIKVVYCDSENDVPSSSAVETTPIRELEEGNISWTITFYASQTLRTIVLCYLEHGLQTMMRLIMMIWRWTSHYLDLGITGIEDPLHEGVREAVADCNKAGVVVKMCTGDNMLTTRAIALQCRIYTPGGIIMEGPHFRLLPPDVMKTIVPRLQTLKELGDIVGVMGEGTNNGPALKTAHVGFAMGITGTEVAKEASDIILMDDNFFSLSPFSPNIR
ncbi:HAD-like domain-containing protein [Lactifluus subvellereus]|nr:HAD-like domain-containing protein [Lactifluus subvellereus]